MIWFLIFCSSIYDGSYTRTTCTAPAQMPNRQACLYIRQQMIDLAESRNRQPGASAKCLGVNSR